MNWLIKFSSWKKAGVLLSLNFIIQFVILLIIYPLISTAIAPLDVQISPSYDAVYSFFDEIGTIGMKYYALNELTIDMLFPIVYSLAYSLLLIELIKSCELIVTPMKYIALLPFGIGISDVVENIHIVAAIYKYPERNDLIVNGLFIANTIKHSFTVVVLSAVLLLLCWLVYRNINCRKKKQPVGKVTK